MNKQCAILHLRDAIIKSENRVKEMKRNNAPFEEIEKEVDLIERMELAIKKQMHNQRER